MSVGVPPSFKDLAKASNDLLNKDFPTAGTELEVKTRAPNGVTFKVGGIKDAKSNVITGDIEGKYVQPKNGLTFTQAWTTNNLLKSQIELEGLVSKGLKLDVQTSLQPDAGKKTAAIMAIYKQAGVHGRANLDLFKGPTFTADVVTGRDGYLVGGDLSYDVQAAKVQKWSGAIGYSAPEYNVTLHALNNLSVYSASYYHKVNIDVEAGAKAIYDNKSPSNKVSIEVGAKTFLDNATFVKAKINNAGILALGYTQALRPGVIASWGLLLDTQKLSETGDASKSGTHKLGAKFSFSS
ncbi:uncharacterized protein L969DRAFT_88777 [Mixia osmundae IAM 14324]|uniref:Uncharacterized protein n=1 Tax=Mixia osmundae (strain CBS 9802 / IAM 14324 / JCM 22182 / KY 12970) TaxID=764103 RepID=G7E0H2_MIXOS|nr:uncharacterized protein L969DRAFT_88777 [Mixia osmundae IAM 14324]KEI38341.1 hypothetical protein L969DRAFT_88777 [Mixia osmundae IAM 14324]GAA96332.1 hypothetical protein E5Q_02998 [Mixia osmundae IAM 14324]